jgi:hypothetical protein
MGAKQGTNRERAIARERAMRALVAAWPESGLTKKAYAARHGMKYSTLLWWCRELKGRDAARARRQEPRDPRRRGALRQIPGLVPVRIVGTASAPRFAGDSGLSERRQHQEPSLWPLAEPETGVIELVPFGHVRIRIPVDFDPRALRLLLDTLEAPC